MKTYKSIQKEGEKLTFGISRMEDIYAKRKGEVDEPHRHNYYTVLVVKRAKGEHRIDFNAYPLEENQIYFVAPGQVHQVIEREKSTGYAMTFSADFLIHNSIPLAFISDLNLFQNYGSTPPLIPSKEGFDQITHYCEEIFSLFHSDQNQRLLSIGAFLKLLLIQCSNSCTLEADRSAQSGNSGAIIRNFKKEVDRHYKGEHSTTFYADLLNISSDHLNRTVKDKLGKTAKEYIQARIITEAKRLLYFTDLSNKEIGYELGFNEPANFSAFFKKCTQLSPSNFKKLELAR